MDIEKVGYGSEKHLSAVDRVVRAVKNGIRAGRLVPGQRLVESDLTEASGVSRVTVRDALRRLELEGLVQFEKYRGARVRKMSRRDVAELNRIRGVLEGYAAAEAARVATPEGLQQLRDIEVYWNGAGLSGEGYSAYNTAFHELIVKLSGCIQLPHFIAQTNLTIFRLQFDFLLLSEERIALSRTEHGRIIEAIAAGDPPAAEQAMRKHIETSTNIILSAPQDYFY